MSLIIETQGRKEGEAEREGEGFWRNKISGPNNYMRDVMGL
jgi:hypothetical protein